MNKGKLRKVFDAYGANLCDDCGGKIPAFTTYYAAPDDTHIQCEACHVGRKECAKLESTIDSQDETDYNNRKEVPHV